MKPQRRISAKLICCRAPMIRAPITATRMSPYIASAERRVNNHMNISKLRPRLLKGRILDFIAILASKGRAQDRKHRNAENGNENRPLQPDRFLLIFPRLGPQVEERN